MGLITCSPIQLYLHAQKNTIDSKQPWLMGVKQTVMCNFFGCLVLLFGWSLSDASFALPTVTKTCGLSNEH